MGFPTKSDHFGVFWGYHHLRKHPYIQIQIHYIIHHILDHHDLPLSSALGFSTEKIEKSWKRCGMGKDSQEEL